MLEPPIQNARRWWSREDLILLVLLGILLYLPGISRISLFDRDEPRFATAAREMITSGDYIVPRFNGELRSDKPPLCYWLMAGGYWLTGSTVGGSELGARLPSALCSTLTLIVLYFAAGRRFGRVTGLLAALILGTTSVFIVESRFATADATMLLFITLCFAGAWRAWDAAAPAPSPAAPRHLPRTDDLRASSGLTPTTLDNLGPRRATPMPLSLALAFWFALALGTLAKGVPLFFVLFPMLILSLATGTLPAELKRWKSHFHLSGIRVAIALAVVALVTLIFALAQSLPALADFRTLSLVLAVLLLGMILAPGLPATALRCFAGGNFSWWRHLRPAIGIPLLIILVGWWVIAAGIATDWKLIHNMVGTHFLNRALGPLLKLLHITIADPGAPGGNDPMKSYGQPPGFYLLTVWGTFWPWSILIVPAAYHALKRLRGRTALSIDPRPYQFLIAWIVPTWIVLELARGKLFHYSLPTFIPLAILCADALVQSWHRMTDVFAARWFAWMRWGTTTVWIGLAITLLVLTSWSFDFGALKVLRLGEIVPAMMRAPWSLESPLFWRCVPLAGALFALGVASAIAWSRPSWPFVVVLGYGAVLLIADTLVLPEIPALRISKSLGERITEIRKAEPQYKVAFFGYDEPTVVFYAGTHVQGGNLDAFITKAGFASSLPTPPQPATALSLPAATAPFITLPAIESTTRPAPPAAAPRIPYLIIIDEATRHKLDDRHLTYYTLRHLTGLDTGNFKPVEVHLITNIPPKDFGPPATTPTTTPTTTSQPASRP